MRRWETSARSAAASGSGMKPVALGDGIDRSSPRRAVRPLADRRGVDTADRPFVHRAAFSETEGRQDRTNRSQDDGN
ncbi:hypothetical protein SCH4B_0060 [Ruegeria sp. TrichCH4B]|nr:hypothetical protein SCH4B_0060 [Ruegeria sp. TrichCH4B]